MKGVHGRMLGHTPVDHSRQMLSLSRDGIAHSNGRTAIHGEDNCFENEGLGCRCCTGSGGSEGSPPLSHSSLHGRERTPLPTFAGTSRSRRALPARLARVCACQCVGGSNARGQSGNPIITPSSTHACCRHGQHSSSSSSAVEPAHYFFFGPKSLTSTRRRHVSPRSS